MYGKEEIWQKVLRRAKVNYLKEYLKSVTENKLIIFTDSYDVIMNNNINILLENYKQFNNKVIFASETFCWPDSSQIIILIM